MFLRIVNWLVILITCFTLNYDVRANRFGRVRLEFSEQTERSILSTLVPMSMLGQ